MKACTENLSPRIVDYKIKYPQYNQKYTGLLNEFPLGLSYGDTMDYVKNYTNRLPKKNSRPDNKDGIAEVVSFEVEKGDTNEFERQCKIYLRFANRSFPGHSIYANVPGRILKLQKDLELTNEVFL